MQVAISAFIKKSLKALTFIYCMLMFTFFLFYTENAYFNITAAKYRCFAYMTLSYGILCIICIGIYLFFQSSLLHFIKKFVKSLSFTDWSMLVLVVSHIITTLLCENKAASFSGSWGRYTGLNFTLLLCIMYFLVSRNVTHIRLLLHLFLGSCFIIGMLGLVNALGYDPFHFFVSVNKTEQHWFLSTVGNITFFAHLFCLSLPTAISLFFHAKQKKQRLGYTLWIWLGFSAVVIGNIDGAYLGVAALLIYFFCRSCVNREKLKDFLIVCFTALCSIKLLYFLTYLWDYLTFDGISKLLVNSFGVWIMICSIAVLLILMRIFPDYFRNLPYQTIRSHVLILITVACICLFLSVVYFTWIAPKTSLNGWENYLRFDDAWGHERGYLWKRLTNYYLHSCSPTEWLFGKGLDCTRLFMAEITAHPPTSMYYDHAHNEYLQYLVTSGFLGLAAYLCVWGSLLKRLFQKQDNPYCTTLIAAFLAHGAQAITGLNQPITTPLLFLLFAIANAVLQNPMLTEKQSCEKP